MKKNRSFRLKTCFFVLLYGIVWAMGWVGTGHIQPAGAQTAQIHLHSQQIEASSEILSLKGKVRLLQQEAQIFAREVNVHRATRTWRIRGSIKAPLRMQTPQFTLQATTMDYHETSGAFEATAVRVASEQYGFVIVSERLNASAFRWAFQEVEVRLPGIPGVFLAEQAYFLPDGEHLWLQGVRYRPVETKDFFLAWPDVQWAFQQKESDLRLRPETARFQPLFSLENGWEAGVSAEVFRSERLQVFDQLTFGATGVQNTTALAWLPTQNTTVQALTNLSYLTDLSPETSFSGRIDLLQRTPMGWGQTTLSYLQPDRFLQRTGLPLRSTSGLFSGAEAFWTTPVHHYGGLQSFAMLSGQWGNNQQGQDIQQLSGIWQGDMALIDMGIHQWRGSVQAHLLSAWGAESTGFPVLTPTLGLRLLDHIQLDADLGLGVYAETYLSGWSASRFLSPYRLSPWLGGMMRWQMSDQVALAADAALSPLDLTWTQCNALLSWRWEAFYVHLGFFVVQDLARPEGFTGGPRVSLQWVAP